jgi:hypothetical protein
METQGTADCADVPQMDTDRLKTLSTDSTDCADLPINLFLICVNLRNLWTLLIRAIRVYLRHLRLMVDAQSAPSAVRCDFSAFLNFFHFFRGFLRLFA